MRTPGRRAFVAGAVALAAMPADAIAVMGEAGMHGLIGRESHAASLRLPQVRAAIARARPLIAGFDSSVETGPVGGVGLATGGRA